MLPIAIVRFAVGSKGGFRTAEEERQWELKRWGASKFQALARGKKARKEGKKIKAHPYTSHLPIVCPQRKI